MTKRIWRERKRAAKTEREEENKIVLRKCTLNFFKLENCLRARYLYNFPSVFFFQELYLKRWRRMEDAHIKFYTTKLQLTALQFGFIVEHPTSSRQTKCVMNRNSGPTAYSSIFIQFDFSYSPERFGRYTLNSYYVVCTTFFWQYWRRSRRRRRYTVVQRLNAQEPKDTTERPQFITNNNETNASVCGCANAE